MEYQNGLGALLAWVQSIVEKEYRLHDRRWEIANRQQGGSAWYFWERGDAPARAGRISKMRGLLAQIDRVLGNSEELLKRDTP